MECFLLLRILQFCYWRFLFILDEEKALSVWLFFLISLHCLKNFQYFALVLHVFEMYVYINAKLCFDASFNDIFEAGARVTMLQTYNNVLLET